MLDGVFVRKVMLLKHNSNKAYPVDEEDGDNKVLLLWVGKGKNNDINKDPFSWQCEIAWRICPSMSML